MNDRMSFAVAVASLSCLASLFQAAFADVPAPPIVVNCGPATDEAAMMLAEAGEQRELFPKRLVHLPDLRKTSEQPYGHRGGEGYWLWHGGSRPSLGPRWESDLFATGRIAPESYFFDIPTGKYQVTIGISEGHVHVAGQRKFHILLNGTVIAEDVDPVGQAGYKEPMMISATVDVGDQQPLTVAFRSRTESPAIVSAIWVTPYSHDGGDVRHSGPALPLGVRATGSYGSNLVSWQRPRDFSISHFVIRRRSESEREFRLITSNPIYAHRWIDRDTEEDTAYAYQVGSVDDRGQISWSSTVTATPKPKDASTLPIYNIQLSKEALRRMATEVHEDQTERGTLTCEGQAYPMEIRIRGASTRNASKKSYRVRFTEASPLARKVTYLKAEPMDHTMQQEKLSCDLFRAVGATCSEATYVNVFVNDEYAGVYLDMEPVRSPFKRTKGLSPDGTLIRANTFQHMERLEDIGTLRGNVGSLDQLKEFVKAINHTPRGDFEDFVRQKTDWPRVMDYLALIVLTHRTEIEANDYFFYRAPDTKRWSFIPWDHNNGNFHVQAYQNRIGEPYIHVFPQTIQQLGWEPNYWYVLPSRVFQSPALRAEYLNRLETLTREWLMTGKLDSMIDANYRLLRDEYPRDPHRWPFAESDPFRSSARDLKEFVRQHAKQILRQIALERERRRTPVELVISEFSFGEKSGWIELHHRGRRPQSLDRVHLVTKDVAGNWRMPLDSEPDMKPGEYRVIEVPYQPIDVPRFSDAEARERWEIERWRSREKEAFPGFSPEGGFLGLTRQEPRRRTSEFVDDDDRERETILDFFFYGPFPDDNSYGRTNAGFSFQTPSSGRACR